DATKSPIAQEALCRIGALYAIEAEIIGKSADVRLAERQARAVPLLTAFKAWLEARTAFSRLQAIADDCETRRRVTCQQGEGSRSVNSGSHLGTEAVQSMVTTSSLLTRHLKHRMIAWLLITLVLGLDQLSKQLALTALGKVGLTVVLPGPIDL